MGHMIFLHPHCPHCSDFPYSFVNQNFVCVQYPDNHYGKEYGKDEKMPWDHIFSGVNKSYLYSEYEQAQKGIATPDCKAGCRNCGALSLCNGGKCDV